MIVKRIAMGLVATAASATLFAAPAFAGNAHFIKSQTKASASGATLTVSFKEAGLESGSVETVTVTADLVAVYQCINGGGNNPNDPAKTVDSSTVSGSDTFTAGKNGNLTGKLTLTAPAQSDALSCPKGQKETLTQVTWSNISITDETSGAYLAIAGTFTSGTKVK